MQQMKSRVLFFLVSLTFLSAPVWATQSSLELQADPEFNQDLLIDVNAVTDVTSQFDNDVACRSFSNEVSLGTWGTSVANEIASGWVSLLSQGPADIAVLCPNYKTSRMTDRQRQEMWVVLINSMAQYESSCRSGASARGVNGPAAGLFQLYRGREQAYSGGCRRGDATKPDRAIKCVLSMLNDQVGRDGVVFSNSSYWAVLRPNNHVRKAQEIQQAVQLFAPCGNR